MMMGVRTINVFEIITFIIIEIALFSIIPFSIKKRKKLNLKRDLKQERRNLIAPKKTNFFNRRKKEVEEVIESGTSKINYDTYLKMTAFSVAVGIFIGIIFKNILMVIILAIGFAYVPVQILKFKQIYSTIALNEQLEPAMHTVTNSYLQTSDIIRSISDSSDRVEGILKTVFKQFLVDTAYNNNVKKALVKMRDSIDNVFFKDWCNVLIQCQDDSDLKYILPSILEEMSDIRRMQYELDTMMFKIYRDYIGVVAVVLISVPLMFFINNSWFMFLVNSMIGKIITSVTCIVTLIATAYVIKENKPASVL